MRRSAGTVCAGFSKHFGPFFRKVSGEAVNQVVSLCIALLSLSVIVVTVLWVLALRNARLLRAEIAELEADQLVDPMFRLPNRRGLALMAQPLLHAARRNGDALFCFVIAVEGLDEINEFHGRATGDKVLGSVGQMLRAHMRGTDVVGRWSGTKFCVVGPGPGSSLADIQRRLISALTENPPMPPTSWDPQISVGSALLTPWVEGTIETLLARADDDAKVNQALRVPTRGRRHTDDAPAYPQPRRPARALRKNRQ